MDTKLIISQKKYKGETSVLSVRLPTEMIKEINRIAESTGRNRNEIITKCMEYALENLSVKE